MYGIFIGVNTYSCVMKIDIVWKAIFLKHIGNGVALQGIATLPLKDFNFSDTIIVGPKTEDKWRWVGLGSDILSLK